VDGDLHIDHCDWITYLPNDIAVNKCVDITKCPNLKKLPDLFEYHKLYVMWCFNLLNVLGNGFVTAFEKIKDDTKKRVE
jgi:hypothetical protein